LTISPFTAPTMGSEMPKSEVRVSRGMFWVVGYGFWVIKNIETALNRIIF